MLAVTYMGPSQVKALETPIPNPGPNEALVKVRSTGICGSDLAIVTGNHPRAKAPLVIGHEFSGEIVELSTKEHGGFKVGDKVTLFPLLDCGKCYACRNGLNHVCSSLRVIGFDCNGGMAEYVRLPIRNLIKLPDLMSHEIGSLIEPLAVGVHAVSMVKLHHKNNVVVIGAGPIGLLTAMVLSSHGLTNLYITDIDPYRLEIAKDLGLTPINGKEVDVVAFIKEKTNGNGADIVFEAAGVQDSAKQMIGLLRPRGTIVNVSVFKKQPIIDMRSLNFKELTIIGSRVYTRDDYSRAIEIANSLPLKKIISHRLPLTEVEQAFNLFFNKQSVCKVLFQPFNKR